MSQNKNITYLYRIENPSLPARPDGVVSHEKLVGSWFTPNSTRVVQYLKKSQRALGTQLVVAEVPTDKLPALHVSEHPIASRMDVENDNYIVPRDGSIPTIELPLDELVGDLNPNILQQKLEAAQRIGQHLRELSLLNEKPE